MKVVCPESSCRGENEVYASECVHCGMPLQSYVQLLHHPAYLFNQGLIKARQGELERARDLFAAVVYWCPKDVEARNALAMACFALHDLIEARRQWECVLAQMPTDALALHGLRQIETAFQPSRLSTYDTVHAGSVRKQVGKILIISRKKKKKKS